jgi:hypothetical protein
VCWFILEIIVPTVAVQFFCREHWCHLTVFRMAKSFSALYEHSVGKTAMCWQSHNDDTNESDTLV